MVDDGGGAGLAGSSGGGEGDGRGRGGLHGGVIGGGGTCGSVDESSSLQKMVGGAVPRGGFLVPSMTGGGLRVKENVIFVLRKGHDLLS